jgi:hypothetical protein
MVLHTRGSRSGGLASGTQVIPNIARFIIIECQAPISRQNVEPPRHQTTNQSTASSPNTNRSLRESEISVFFAIPVS